MINKDFKIRPKNSFECVLTWISKNASDISWVFINGKLAVGPYIVKSVERALTIPFVENTTSVIEIHDFPSLESIPESCEIMPQVKPLLSWLAVPDAEFYYLFYGEKLLLDGIPHVEGIRQEINCPIALDGRQGQYHEFHVEAANKYGVQSEDNGERILFWAYELPTPTKIEIQKNENNFFDFIIGV
jgi:hypothetical protein